MPDSLTEFVSLSSCKHLGTLVLKFHWRRSRRLKAWASFWALISDHISHLCPAIRRIHLDLCFAGAAISFSGLKHPFRHGVEALDPVFEQEALANLQHVGFGFEIYREYRGEKVPEAPITLEQVEDAIQAKLPKLYKRGIAHVRYKYDPICI